MKVIISLLLVLVTLSGTIFIDSYGDILPNNVFTLEGSGYAVTENVIKISKIDISLSTQKQTGNNISASIEDGVITVDAENFLATELKTTILRQGQYIRINGIVETNTGNEASVRFFGKLIEESKDASIYGFTGRLTTNDNNYKIIYTSKLSELLKINVAETKSQINKKLTIDILKGASTQGVGSTIGSADVLQFRHFSQERISINPGTTITFVNNDNVSHSILSGKQTGDRYNQYVADGRVSTGEILPGKSMDITFEKPGFYRLYDPNYQFMEITAYVFPNIENNIILGQTKNIGN